MGIAFDVHEYWGMAEAEAALESALRPAHGAVTAFEQAFADYVGGLDAVFLISGREAIRQALELVGVGSGDEVVLSAFNCTRVADAVLRCRAVPVLVDIRLPGGEPDLDLVLEALSPRVRAVIVPHLYGIPVDLRGIGDELDQRGVILVEDCAHCLGALVGDTPAGSQGSYSVFSFNTGKPLTLANGGMLVCSDPRELARFRRMKARRQERIHVDPRQEFQYVEQTLEAMAALRSKALRGPLPAKPASTSHRLLRSSPGLAGIWFHNRLRPNAPLTHPFNEEFEAVGAVRAHLGLELLRKWPNIKAIRNRHAEYLRDRIRHWPWGRIAEVPKAVEPAYHKVNLFAGELTAAQTEQAIDQLRSAGIWAGRWPFLKEVPHLIGRFGGRSGLPNMRKMAHQGLHLPVHQEMNHKDLDYMIDTLYSVRI